MELICLNGSLTKIKRDINSPTTPPSLLGIERRIA